MGRSLRYSYRNKRKKSRKRAIIYWISLGVYTVILLVLSVAFLRYTDKCLIKYEEAQSENAMPGIVKDFESMIEKGMISDTMTIVSAAEFEESDVYTDIYLDMLKSKKNFYFEKDSSSYLTESPTYDIMADDDIVAKVKLKAKNEHVIFGILTIMDWEIDEVEPVMTYDTRSYRISVPDNYKVFINGRELGRDYLTGEREKNEVPQSIADYVEVPDTVEYKVDNLINTPDVEIFDLKGEKVNADKDKDGNIRADISFEEKKIPKKREQTAYTIAKMWEDFVTNDLDGKNHGFGTISEYLIKDSYYWNMAYEYATGPDIGMVSDHTMAEPPYTNYKVSNYTEYSDTVFSCHIYFEKNMLLTRAHNKKRTETVDSTFYYVYYDDSDDGEDNPSWKLVDMA